MTTFFIETIEFLDKYANLILVLITGAYAFLTFRMVGIMKRQIVSNIKVRKVSLSFRINIGREDYNNISLKSLSKDFLSKKQKDIVLLWRVSIDFLNLSSGAGTIDQPKLVLKFKKNRAVHEIATTEERIGGERKTTHLLGGGFKKIDLEYFCSCDKNNKKLIKHLKTDYKHLEYFISYNDNFGKEHLVKINNIFGIK